MRRRGVAIGGMMGVGKSTVGRLVAARMGLWFVDTDDEMEARFGPVDTQIRRDEALFRAREAVVVAESAQAPAVVATGGGAWVNAATRRVLAEAGDRVVLTAPASVLRQRIGGDLRRPLAGSLEPLLAARREAYADADHHVDATGDVDEVVERVLAAIDPVSIRRIAAARGPYEVCLSRSLHGLTPALRRAGLAGRRLVVVTDARVGPHWLDRCVAALAPAAASVRTCVIEGEEAGKTLASWAQLIDTLLAGALDRDAVVVALGGGVVGDLAGFAAATLLRGVDWVLVPTTLLAMVDSSVGGKTGVNHERGKNLIGAFHAPALVYAATDTLTTLPRRERIAGLGEVVKTAVVGDPTLLQLLETRGAGLWSDAALLSAVIDRCVAVKASIVERDEQEHGLRQALNLGHTVAHGLEAALGYGVLRHGEAVALGLVAEAAWAVREGLCEEPDLPRRLMALHAVLELPTAWPDAVEARVVAAMRLDKKGRADRVSVPVPIRVGTIGTAQVQSSQLADLLRMP